MWTEGHGFTSVEFFNYIVKRGYRLGMEPCWELPLLLKQFAERGFNGDQSWSLILYNWHNSYPWKVATLIWLALKGGSPLARGWPKWTSTPYAPSGTPLTGFVPEWAWPLPKKGRGSWCFLALNNTRAKKPSTSNTKTICVLVWWVDFVALIIHCYDFLESRLSCNPCS
jgi:hypothetical protein